MLKPKPLLLIEGGAVLAAACVLYHQSHGRWRWFGLLFLAPDLSMLGYLVNTRLGAMTYNLVHTYATPLTLLGVLWFAGQASYAWLAVIWFAHVGFDRMLGYGLKYETAFKDTHLQRVWSGAPPCRPTRRSSERLRAAAPVPLALSVPARKRRSAYLR